MRCLFEVRRAIDMAVGPEYPLDKSPLTLASQRVLALGFRCY